MFLRKLVKNSTNCLYTRINYNYFNQQPQNFDPKKDYYIILNLSKNANDNQIKKSFYKLAKQYHPDVHKGYQLKFKQINEAYQVLSNEETRKQYDSARIWNDRWSQMGSKASQGNYSYSEYQNIYYNMSAEERQQFTRQVQARMRKVGFIFGGLFIFWLFFSRTPHKAYTQMNGSLVPIDNVAPFQYPQSVNYQNPYGGQPYGQPYGQQPDGQPYSNPQSNYGSGQTYGSQYPQSQYLQKNQNQTPYGGSSVYQGNPSYTPYQATNQAYQAQRSQYTIDRPQPHQPYPNSHYAQRPIQSNYRSDFKTQAPQGLDD